MKQDVYFLSHGGGPWPWIPEWNDRYQGLRQATANIPNEIPQKPRAILMVSAHWITQGGLAIMTNPKPEMFYDYYGFPEYTYHIQYPAPGDPILAKEIEKHLISSGFNVVEDNERGFDHGAFVPLALAFPDADIPVVQLSIERSFAPAYHIRLGQALNYLREQNVLIIGSGLSFHNMRMFNPSGATFSLQFDEWLRKQMLAKNSSVASVFSLRKNALLQWEQAPSARFAHPMEDHLMPLMVAVGAAGEDEAFLHYHEDNTMGGIAASGFRFGS